MDQGCWHDRPSQRVSDEHGDDENGQHLHLAVTETKVKEHHEKGSG